MTTISPEVRALASRLAKIEAALRSRGDQLAYSSFDDGALCEFKTDEAGATQVAQYGQQFDGTSGAAVLVSPEPPKPTAPTVTGIPGGLRVAWDGTFEDDLTVIAPMDWSRTDVTAGPVDMDPIATPPKFAFVSPRGGEVFLTLPEGDYDIALVTRTLSGRPSVPSDIVTATAAALPDQGDIDAVIEAANGKNKIFHDTTDPDVDGTAVGDVWFKHEAVTNVVIAQWNWDGAGWLPQEISGEVLAYIDAGKITTGVLSAIDIEGVNVTGSTFTGSEYVTATDPGTGAYWSLQNGRIEANSGDPADAPGGLTINEANVSFTIPSPWDFGILRPPGLSMYKGDASAAPNGYPTYADLSAGLIRLMPSEGGSYDPYLELGGDVGTKNAERIVRSYTPVEFYPDGYSGSGVPSVIITDKGIEAPDMRPVQGSGAGTFTKAGAGVEQFANAAGIVFVAPSSGRVKITVSGFLRAAADGSSTTLQFEVRLGGAIKSGTVIYGSDVNKSLVNYNVQFVKGDHAELVTGLTPGQTYNAYVTMYSAAAAAQCSNTSILVEPLF